LSPKFSPNVYTISHNDFFFALYSTATADSLVFFRCYRCSFVVHNHCLPSLDDDEGKSIKRKKRQTDKGELLEIYRKKWKCKDCLKWDHEVDRILTYKWCAVEDNDAEGEPENCAGKSIDNIELVEMQDKESDPLADSTEKNNDAPDFKDTRSSPSVRRLFLIKFKDLSYRHVTWVPESWLSNVNASMIRGFLKRYPDIPPSMEEALPEEWKKVDRVLDVEFKNGKKLYNVMFTKTEVDFQSVKEVKRAFIKWQGLHYDEGKVKFVTSKMWLQVQS
jgi:hypothetical protein